MPLISCYGGMATLQRNELDSLVAVLRNITDRIQRMQDAGLKTCADFSPREEALNFAFIINLYEDMTQELRHIHKVDSFAPVVKIFQTIEDLDAILAQIK